MSLIGDWHGTLDLFCSRSKEFHYLSEGTRTYKQGWLSPQWLRTLAKVRLYGNKRAACEELQKEGYPLVVNHKTEFMIPCLIHIKRDSLIWPKWVCAT